MLDYGNSMGIVDSVIPSALTTGNPVQGFNAPTMWESFKLGLSNAGKEFGALPFAGGIDQTTGQAFKGKLDYGLAAANAGINAFLGMKQYGLAKKQFEFQKGAWNKEFDAQKGLTNSRLADRQDRRVKEGTARMGVADYMANYGVK
jgi:hypothetical protein